MPPSPRLKATLNVAAYERACAELHIIPPSVEISNLPGADGRYGDFTWPNNRIRLFLGGIEGYERDKLRFAQSELSRTMLHELRHAYQYQLDRSLTNPLVTETDAEGWAVRRLSSYRQIVRLSRTFPNSGFSRLSSRNVRRSV